MRGLLASFVARHFVRFTYVLQLCFMSASILTFNCIPRMRAKCWAFLRVEAAGDRQPARVETPFDLEIDLCPNSVRQLDARSL